MGDYTYYYNTNDAIFGGMFAGAVTGVIVVAAIFSIAVYIFFFFSEHRILKAQPWGL